jgi:hypothetical protein
MVGHRSWSMLKTAARKAKGLQRRSDHCCRLFSELLQHDRHEEASLLHNVMAYYSKFSH